jgi:hypothetical protein
VTAPPADGPGWTPPGAAPHADRQDRPSWLRPPPQPPPGSGWPPQPPAGAGWPPRPPAGSGWPPPQPPTGPRGRVRPLVAAVVLLLVVGLAGGGLLVGTRREEPAGGDPGGGGARAARPPAARAPGGSTATPAAVRDVQDAVTGLRGLRFRRRVPVTVESPARLSRRLQRVMTAEIDQADLTRQGRAMELLGQLPPGTDLARLLRDIRAEGVGGFYLPGRPPKGRLFVRSSRGLDPFARYILAHELTHAVTDQHYDLTYADRLEADAGREDELVAYAGLLEGDANLVAQLYLAKRLTPAEQASFALTAAGQRTPRQHAAPAAIRESLQFPYQTGLRFVAQLYRAGGWAAVNRAYRDPPTSTEQVLHPERYLRNRDQPQRVAVPDLSARLGPGWRPAVELGFGELDARLLLQGELPATDAATGAAGWDGGGLRTFQRGDRTALAVRTVWDSTGEADQFCGAMRRWAGGRFGSPTRAAALRWSGAGQHAALRCGGARVAWLSAPDRPTLDRLLRGLGGP